MDRQELEKLSPEERIKRLRELEEERKREIEEAEQLIQESLKELGEEDRLKQIEVPEIEQVDISSLFDTATEDTVEETVKGAGSAAQQTEYNLGLGEGDHDHEQESYAAVVKREDASTPKYEGERVSKQTTASMSIVDQIQKYSKG